jgi:hypothetical protein
MKKKLEAELISIAHRVLKLKGKEDVLQLHREAQLLCEQLSILKFYYTHIDSLKEELPQESFEHKLDQFNAAPIEELIEETPAPVEIPEAEAVTPTPEKEEVIVESVEAPSTLEEEIEEELVEEITIEAVSEEEVVEKAPLFAAAFELETEELEVPEEKTPEAPKQISLEDFLNEDYKEPEFVKVNEVPAETKDAIEITFVKKEAITVDEEKVSFTKTETIIHKTETKPLSLNDTLIKGINVGLNDRIAFVKHLFNGSNEDYNRVMSQLNSFDSLEEAQDFVENMVKPDYNKWEGKEDYAQRFMNLVEKKFV